MIIGTIRELWRYPVKSMGGEQLGGCIVNALGIPGDRGWAVRDDAAREIRGAKYLPLLLQCMACYREEPSVGVIPPVDITLPDGMHVGSDDPAVQARLSVLLGRAVSLWPRQAASQTAHYRRAYAGAHLVGWLSRTQLFRVFLQAVLRFPPLGRSMRETFGRTPDEPLPDLSMVPAELFEFTSPPGTYFDAFPLHLLTTASLVTMARLNPAAAWDVRRFRPNILIETVVGVEGLVEVQWGGRTLRLGALHVRCEMPTVRCGMTAHAQADLPQDPTVLRTIVREAGQALGCYVSVLTPGRVAVGDVVELP